ALVGLVIVALPLVNLAFLLPRLSYLPETPLALGYRTLRAQITQLVGRPQPLLGTGGYRPRFPLEFGVAGDGYLGAIALGLVFAGWRQRSLRRLWLTFAVLGLGSYT